jgi:hypothetical protein
MTDLADDLEQCQHVWRTPDEEIAFRLAEYWYALREAEDVLGCLLKFGKDIRPERVIGNLGIIARVQTQVWTAENDFFDILMATGHRLPPSSEGTDPI